MAVLHLLCWTPGALVPLQLLCWLATAAASGLQQLSLAPELLLHVLGLALHGLRVLC
jgi:hypothetical protein